jgi:IS30 family transposase
MGKHYDHLVAEERGTIMAMTLEGRGVRVIALALGRSPSTVSRERRRNGWKPESERGPIGRPAVNGGYDAKRAGQRAARLHRKPRRPRKLARGTPLWAEVRRYLERGWSPEQIAGTLKKRSFGQPPLYASHETIYLYGDLCPPQGRVTSRARRAPSPRTRRPARAAACYHPTWTHARFAEHSPAPARGQCALGSPVTGKAIF